ncbi:hypothetical protein D5086_000962 [Populus alba]|uniref:Uncharacterized protein n=1 Tax=Populus alba TaxID=43335 RepID=A0ACC4CYN4_POPAL
MLLYGMLSHSSSLAMCELGGVAFGYYLLRCCRWILCAFILMVVFVILSEIKERIKKNRDEKKTEKVELMAETQKTQSKDRPKGVAPKGPKLGGGGGG